jgi:hypothetical protein
MKDTHLTNTLEQWLKAYVVGLLGEYPHAKLSLDDREKGTGVPKQTTRYFKCWCPKSGYTCRASRQWIDQYGPPISPATKKPMDSDYIPDADAAKIAGEREDYHDSLTEIERLRAEVERLKQRLMDAAITVINEKDAGMEVTQ